jgi:hypothetical protein
MKESYSERLAIYTGPESCGVVREDNVEALTGKVRWEQQEHLQRMLRGFYHYFELHHCERKLNWVRHQLQRQWINKLYLI